ncbi:ABC transporter ATP-binding protein [Pyrococcus furiosus DSM 3638]|nr:MULTISPECIES: ABC transporter ATP-binding protein [Pyrococcus]AFN03882.1 ABC transporter [Pyrococcus furiosus COM1]MDK2868788.1 type transport system ATP-binding protein [Pyrococcus sp.]QEK78746.1 ABC transporter ATP-binding protein [Pyrococcus furiosus DSM 3638]
MKLEIRELSVGYKRPLLEDITLELENGDAVNFYGPNGIGKTTLLKTIATYLKPLKGEILYNGAPIRKVRGKIFFLPESILVPNKVRARDYLKAVASLYGVNPSMEEVVRALDLVGISDENIKFEKCSQGMKRRIQLASALLVNAEIFVLDDPVVAIDEDSKHEILKGIVDTLKKRGIVIISSREKLPYFPINEDVVKYKPKL